MNYKTQFLMALIFLYNFVHGIKMTRKEVLNIFYDKRINDTCPEYSYTLDNNSSCHFTFYCIDDDNCQSISDPNSSFVEFVKNDGSIHKYLKNNNACSVDSECLSNSCSNSTCIADGKTLFTECIDRTDVLNDYTKMFCGRLEGEKCSFDSQCAGECDYDTCNSNHDRNTVTENGKRTITILAILLLASPLLCILCCIGCICFCIKKKDREEKERKLKNINSNV